MIYTELTNRAMCLAYDAHHGQLDHGGVPMAKRERDAWKAKYQKARMILEGPENGEP